MKLAFSGKARHTDFTKGYRLYTNRSRKYECVDEKTYNRIIRRYCGFLADRLYENGFVDLPCELGTIAAAKLIRRPQYRGDRFIGYGKMDWVTGKYNGDIYAFGIVFLPKHEGKLQNLRSFGFVANRKLFKKIKNACQEGRCTWKPMEFKDEMI